MLSSERGYSVIEKIKAEGYKMGFEEGFKIGYKIGYKIGFEEGFKIGLRESRMKIAMRMIAAGFPSSTISDITEIPIGEIEEMRAESAKPSAQS